MSGFICVPSLSTLTTLTHLYVVPPLKSGKPDSNFPFKKWKPSGGTNLSSEFDFTNFILELVNVPTLINTPAEFVNLPVKLFVSEDNSVHVAPRSSTSNFGKLS